MRRQVNFIMSNGDQERLLIGLKEKFQIGGMRLPFRQGHMVIDDPVKYAVWVNDQFTPILFQENELQNLVFTEFLPGRGYVIDLDNSPAIEFFQCITHENGIQDGRFYYHAKYWEGDYLYDKSEQFLKFAQGVFAFTKKFCVKERISDFYVGPEAYEMGQRGIKLNANL